jgi:SAM-dependent methyltransferase
MVYWMAKAGANATGIDIAREPVEWGREALALDLRQTSLERLQEPEGSFDVVTMMDLIEHVVDLRGFMGRLASLLKPGGLVFVKTPNFGAYQFWGNRLCFEVATLDALFARFGMLPKSATCVLFGVSADVDVWLRQRKRGRGPVRRLVRRLPGIDVVRWLRARLLSRKRMYRFDESGVQGSQIVGCYQKPCRGAQGSAKQGPPGPAVSNGVPGR